MLYTFMKQFSLVIKNVLCILLLMLALVVSFTISRSYVSPLPAQLIVVSPQHEPFTVLLAPFGVGYERELVLRFWQGLNESPEDIQWLTASTRQEALELVRKGQAHVVVGFSTVQEGQDSPPAVTAGPVHYHARTVPVSLPTLESATAKEPTASRHFLDARSWAVWEPFVGDLADKAKAALDADDMDDKGNPQDAYCWFWSEDTRLLARELELFWADLMQPDNTFLEQLEERYYGYLSNTMGPYSVLDFLGIVQKRLPRYSSIIAQAAGREDIDPLLFTAVIIQESRMYEGTVSHTGVQGIMQLTKNTAKYLKVDRMDPPQALRGGARYLRMIWKDLGGLGLEEWDRWFFTLAAFNQGPRRLEGAMELSRQLGGTGRTWLELKEVFPLLSQKKYASMVGQNTCRGEEAVQFVERVRWYYHILRGLIALDRPEAQNLAPLLSEPVARAALGF